MQESIYILLIFIECLLYTMHDAEPHEKQKIVGFLSTLKEPVGGNREKGMTEDEIVG